MTIPSIRHIKHAQRESYYKREITSLFHNIILEDTQLHDVYISRVALSHNRGSCTIFIGLIKGDEHCVDEKIRRLVLYKPSLRASLAKINNARCVPDVFFKFDEKLKKQFRMDQLFDELHATGQL